MLPPPFDQLPNITSPAAHQVHHKFVVCGFNGPDPTVFCGSSNLAEGGEQHNGDNLLEIHYDADVALVLRDQALGSDRPFRLPRQTHVGKKRQPSASGSADAIKASVFLDATDKWAMSDSIPPICISRINSSAARTAKRRLHARVAPELIRKGRCEAGKDPLGQNVEPSRSAGEPPIGIPGVPFERTQLYWNCGGS